jgi:hypothetical protein
MQVIHHVRSEAVIVATVLVGVAERVLNVPDKVKTFYGKDKFVNKILPRLSKGDAGLWDEFKWAISTNRPNDPSITLEKFRKLPSRLPAHTHVIGYDYLLLIPVFIDNVVPPYIPKPNNYGINVDTEYDTMLKKICAAYSARWHL